jgi:hypothetical protein
MNISLDYDDTYTRDPKAWLMFIKLFRARGHKVYCVTMRHNIGTQALEVIDALDTEVDGIYFTGHKAKENFMFDQGIRIDVWIDDQPNFVNQDAKL